MIRRNYIFMLVLLLWAGAMSVSAQMTLGIPPSDEIWYKSIDDQLVYPYDYTAFGGAVFQNTYENGKGVLKFDRALTKIGDNAFLYATLLTEVSLPEGITSIGQSAFACCGSLAAIRLPSTLTAINYNAFESDYNLRYIRIDATEAPVVYSVVFHGLPDDVTLYVPYFGYTNYADNYQYNTFIRNFSFTISLQDETSGTYTYYECVNQNHLRLTNGTSNLEGDIVIPDSVYIPSGVTLPVTEIQSGVLMNDNITSIKFNSLVTDLPDYYLSGHQGITEVELGASHIGNHVLNNCPKLETLHIAAGVASIDMISDGSITMGSQALHTITVDNNNPKYYSPEGSNTIVEKATETLVAGCSKSTVAEGVKVLGPGCFRKTYFPQGKLVLPTTLEKIDTFAVDGWLQTMESLSFTPAELEYYWSYDSYVYSNLNVIVPLEALKIYKSANKWASFDHLTERSDTIWVPQDNSTMIPMIVKPDTSWRYTALLQSAGITATNIALPDSVQAYNDKYYPVTTLPANVLKNNTGITNLHLPASLTYIGDSAMLGCSQLSGVIIEALTPPAIGKDIIDKLTPVYVHRQALEAYTSAAEWASYKIEVIPELFSVHYTTGDYDLYFQYIDSVNATLIAPKAGYSVVPNGELVINDIVDPLGYPYHIYNIADNALRNTDITSLRIDCATGLNAIGDSVLWGCNKLTQISTEVLIPPTLGTGLLTDTMSDIPVYVHADTYDAYHTATHWKDLNLKIMLDTIVIHNQESKYDLYYVVCNNDDVRLVAPKGGYQIAPVGDVNIPDSITVDGTSFGVVEISNNALQSTNVQSLTIGQNVKTIGTTALADNKLLTRVNLGSVQSIGELALRGCIMLDSLHIPGTVTNIGYNNNGPITAGCTKMTRLYVDSTCQYYFTPDSSNAIVTRDDSTLRAACPATVLTPSIRRLGVGSMRGLGIDSVTIPERLWYINQYAFDNSLRHMECLCTTPPTLADYWSYDANVYTNVDVIIPLETMDTYKAANKWSRFSNIAERSDTIYIEHRVPSYKLPFVVKKYKLLGYTAMLQRPETPPSGDLVLPDSVRAYNGKNYPMLVLDSALSNCPDLTSVTFPSTLHTISNYSLANCPHIRAIHIPASVEVIGVSAFWNDLATLDTITVDPANKKYRSPDGCNAIIDWTDWLTIGCRNSKVVEGVVEIGNDAFRNVQMDTIVLPASLRNIRVDAFYGCTALRCIRMLGDTMVTHHPAAFDGVDISKIDIYVPTGRIPTFSNWTNFHDLREWYLAGDTIAEVHEATAYTSTYTLYYIAREDGTAYQIETPDYGGYRTYANGDLYMPDTVGWRLRLTDIGERAFANASELHWLVLHDNIHSLGSYALTGCSGLESIVCYSTVPPVADSTTFIGVDKSIPVTIPDGTRDQYKVAPGWCDFECLKDPQPVPPPTPEGWYAPAAAPAPRKILRDGRILILRNNQIYDILGR